MFACNLRVAAAATAATAAPNVGVTLMSSQQILLRLFSSGGSHYFTGIVDRFRSDKGYGFLVTDDTRMRVYCHREQINHLRVLHCFQENMSGSSWCRMGGDPN